MVKHNDAARRWENFNILRKEMSELADEIIEEQKESDSGHRLIDLYDLSDSVFSAQNVKRLLVALEAAEQRSMVNGISSICYRQYNEDANQSIIELKAALATPIRLPDIECSFCANSDKADGHHEGQEFYRSNVADAIRAAGFTVECDLCSACNERYCGNCAHANGAKVQ